jgi:hypothetical protein
MEIDDAHLLAWLDCLGASTLDTQLPSLDGAHLASSLILPPQFGDVGLHSLIGAADEELSESWEVVTVDLIE